MVAQFNSLQEFLSMGGYGFYVWTAYGAMVCMLIAGVWAPLRKRRES